MKLPQLISFMFLTTPMSFANVLPFLSDPQVPLTPPPLSQAPADSRRIILRSSSQPISGSYPLYDLLSISSESGSISVDVTPQPASAQDPSHPASLKIRSHSGSVYATFSEEFLDQLAGGDGLINTAIQPGIPVREYITSVQTRSASISGTFPLGSYTSLDSQAGSISGIDLVVVPTIPAEPRRVKTTSRDGMQSVRVVDDEFWAASKEAWWEGMVSRHESHSGSINIQYPDSWEGTIEVETESGSINVTGRGVEIIRQRQGKVIARKGRAGGGKVIVRARSGSVDLRFG
ncbi:hypothetical protein F5Y03DRAFT_280521 [Xylaria venustula]|nr:hypothetical protein F5Y03DRAFT_280521 [Xylaria venustula]